MAQNKFEPARHIQGLNENGVKKETKFIIVTGGTISGLGKGTAISSLGVVLKSHGLRVTAMKIDPYLNVDAGTMSPYEHGEVYVLDDGGEADLDLGNYERFLDLSLSSVHSLTSGKIYDLVIRRERAGDYLGKTVQMVPHVTDAIQDWIIDVSKMCTDRSGVPPDVCLVELGGTVGDIESAVYLEALQQMQFRYGHENFLVVHVGFVPFMAATGEQKTKPCQHSVKIMREAGLKPDFLFCRSEQKLGADIRKKLSLFCQVSSEEVISLHDSSNIYHVPLVLSNQNVGEIICKKLGLEQYSKILAPVMRHASASNVASGSNAGTPAGTPANKQSDALFDIFGMTNPKENRLGDWTGLAERVDSLSVQVSIAMVGKYTGLTDSYMSVIKALKHATIEAGVNLELVWIESTDLEPNMKTQDAKKYESAWVKLRNVDGVLVPGGFGTRGIEGMILAAKYCRESETPYFGICVGMQVAVIEACRGLLGNEGANSTEFSEMTPHPCVVFMPEHSATVMGGTMRLGSRCTIIKNQQSLAGVLYGGCPVIYERHRHRYEVNSSYVQGLENQGLMFSGQDERGQRMEIIELNGHPFYFGVQFHPEFKSRPNHPSPCFLGFILAAAGQLGPRIEADGGKLVVGNGFAVKPPAAEGAEASGTIAGSTKAGSVVDSQATAEAIGA